jgi:hypothetical protein
MDINDKQDKEIEELQKQAQQFSRLEAQISLVKSVVLGVLGSVLGLAGTILVKWNDIEIDLTDVSGKLIAHERESAQVFRSINEQLEECHEDLKELTNKMNLGKGPNK